MFPIRKTWVNWSLLKSPGCSIGSKVISADWIKVDIAHQFYLSSIIAPHMFLTGLKSWRWVQLLLEICEWKIRRFVIASVDALSSFIGKWFLFEFGISIVCWRKIIWFYMIFFVYLHLVRLHLIPASNWKFYASLFDNVSDNFVKNLPVKNVSFQLEFPI